MVIWKHWTNYFLQYPNLIFGDIDENTSIKGITITDNVSKSDNSVTINSGTKLYLKNANRLVVDADQP